MKKILIAVLITIISACSSRIAPPGEKGPGLKTAKARKGQELFMKRCDRCHPGGMGGVGPSIINKPLPGFLIKTQVRVGFGAMPAFNKKKISADELKDIVAYIKEMHQGTKD
jgi:mono/diheme cytochrome c family protein